MDGDALGVLRVYGHLPGDHAGSSALALTTTTIRPVHWLAFPAQALRN